MNRGQQGIGCQNKKTMANLHKKETYKKTTVKTKAWTIQTLIKTQSDV